MDSSRYLTADEKFVNQLMALGLFSIKPFYGNARSDCVIVEIDFIDNDIEADIESLRKEKFERLLYGKSR